MATNPSEVAPVQPPPANDLGASYQAYRDDISEKDALADMMKRVASQKQQQAAEATAKPGAAPAAKPPVDTGSPLLRAAGAVASDIGHGIVEAPGAVVKGARDAFGNLFDAGDELAGWLEKEAQGTPLEFATGGIQIDKNGVTFLSPAKVRQMREAGQMTRTSDLSPLPEQENPSTVTGGIIKNVAQFITGMAGAGRVLTGPGAVMNTIKGAAASYTALDPHQQRLSDLIEKYPALSNPVTRFLQSKPDDTEAEGRFKNAVEGTGLGLLTDGFVKAVKTLRNGLVARGAQAAGESADDAARVAVEAPGQLPDEAFQALGDESKKSLVLKPSAAQLEDVQAAIKGGEKADPATYINFARIDAPEDVQRVMQKLADLGPPAADEARAGIRSFADMKLDAAHQDAWEALASRRVGQPLSDSQALAARELWAATTDKLTDLATKAATSADPADLFAFRKMLDVHDMVQREVLGARASTARALASWRIPAGGPAERLRDVTAALQASGGNEVTQMLASRVATLGKAGMIREMGQVAQKGAFATSRDAVVEAWINGLLTNPATHVANTMSNAATAVLRMGERYVGSKISQLLGTQDGVAAGEAQAQWFGMVQGIKDMASYYMKSLRAGIGGGEQPESPVSALGIPSITKMEHPPSISSSAFGLDSTGWLGRSVDLGGEVIRAPGKALGLEDEFFKTLGYRMEVNAQAVRQASQEVHAGTLAADALKDRIAEIIANPPENIRLAAADSALYQTFQNAPGVLGKTLGKLTQQFPALKVVLPFTRTPSNIMKYSFERTPLAPLMSSFRASVAAGGARRDLALAQMAMGTSAMLAVADATMSGQISGRGPVEKGQKEAMSRDGWQPYSIKIGDRWVSYNRVDPIGSVLGMAADATESLMHAQHDALDDPDTEKLAVATALAFAGNLTNKTYLSGLTSAIEALNDPQQAAEGWAQRLAGSVVPAGVAQVERVKDPTVREVYSMIDAIRSRTPGLSENLPPKRDLWGQPVKLESGLGKGFDMFSPIYTKEGQGNPIDKEIERLGANVTMPSRKTSFDGVTIDMSQYPQAYSRYVELAGNGLKHPAWNLGARDYLNQVVSGKSPISAVYNLRSDGPDGGKDLFIRHTIEEYRDMARKELLKEFPKLRAEVADKKAEQRALKMPVLDANR